MTRFGSVVVAAVLAAATTVLPGATLAPAAAAVCTDAGGVTVVVDPGSLAGSLSRTCIGGGGNHAATLFGQAGHALERVHNFPGAVCRVDDAPAEANCGRMPPTNRYWGLFWSDGTSGSWVYSSAGVDNLDVPAGGSVAFAWQSSNSRRNPAVKPPDHDGSEVEDPGGSGGSGGGGRTGGGSGGASAGGGSSDAPQSSPPSASESPTSDVSSPGDDTRAGKRDSARGDGAKRDRPREQKSRTAEPTDGATVSPDAVTEGEVATTSQPVTDGGLPLWLVGLAAGCLLAVGAAVAVVRRNAARNA